MTTIFELARVRFLPLLVLGSVSTGCGPVEFGLGAERIRAETHVGMTYDDAVSIVGNFSPSWADNTEDAQRSIDIHCGRRGSCVISPLGWPENMEGHINWRQYHVFVATHRPPDGFLPLEILYLIFDPETKKLIAKVALDESGLGSE